MKEKTIKVKYYTDRIEKLRYIDGKSDWVDLRAAERVEFKAGEFKLVSFGITVELPKGYELHIAPRSSTFKNWGLIQTNGVGVVDWEYHHEGDILMAPMYATRDTVVEVNDRICQFRIMENQPQLFFEEVEELDGKPARGGFGSSGKN